MNQVFAVLLLFVIVSTSYVAGIKTHEYSPIGCFRDKGETLRPLSTLLADLRSAIDWHNLNKTIDKCSQLANERGFIVFGIQFYGECWSGKDAMTSYNQDGAASNCVAGVGQENANFVYKFLTKATKWKKSEYKFIGGQKLREKTFYSGLEYARKKCKKRCENLEKCRAIRLYDLGINLVYCTLYAHVNDYSCPPTSKEFNCLFAQGESWEMVD